MSNLKRLAGIYLMISGAVRRNFTLRIFMTWDMILSYLLVRGSIFIDILSKVFIHLGSNLLSVYLILPTVSRARYTIVSLKF